MDSLIKKLIAAYPNLYFVADGKFYWSPKDQTVYYDQSKKDTVGTWALLHELSHGLLAHASYKTDFELDFEPIGTSMISLGKVEHSASVKINGEFAGCAVFKPMEIYSHSKYQPIIEIKSSSLNFESKNTRFLGEMLNTPLLEERVY